jgi:hypothetical protein
MRGSLKWRAIGAYAKSLAGVTRTMEQLTIWTNNNGILTEHGTPYQIGKRGIATAISCAYWYHHNLGDMITADAIKWAFVDKHGHPAFFNY